MLVPALPPFLILLLLLLLLPLPLHNPNPWLSRAHQG
jgi:hypothetical protein